VASTDDDEIVRLVGRYYIGRTHVAFASYGKISEQTLSPCVEATQGFVHQCLTKEAVRHCVALSLCPVFVTGPVEAPSEDGRARLAQARPPNVQPFHHWLRTVGTGQGSG
jgi:hypothetical protein